MKILPVEQFVGGWFVGKFEPTAYSTPDCEVSYKMHKAGELLVAHYHKIGTEINYLISGQMSINGIELTAPIVFIIPPGEIADPIFTTDVSMIVVKVPSVPGDKYEVTT